MAMTAWRASNTYPSGFVRTDKAAGGLASLLGQPTRRPRPDTSGQSLSELLGRALAAASGVGYQPPRVHELEQLLGAESYRLLMQNPKIAEAIKLWANASGEDRASLEKPMAVLIAHEAGQPGLAWRIRKGIGRLK